MIQESIPIGTRVQVYFNLRKRCWSIRAQHDDGIWRVATYANTVLINDAVFMVNESGRQRVLRTKQKNVHAWVEGDLIGIGSSGMPIMNIWWYKPLRVREVTYNPYKYNQFVRKDKTFEPVLSADQVLLISDPSTIDKIPPELYAYREDMWDEFDARDVAAYDLIVDKRSICHPAWTPDPDDPFGRLVRHGILTSINDGINVYLSFPEDEDIYPLCEHVRRYGGESWGFWNETQDHFYRGFDTAQEAHAALKAYAAGLEG